MRARGLALGGTYLNAVVVDGARVLTPGGLLVVEHSDRQGRTAPALLEGLGGWAEVADHQDYAGRDRYVTARWTGA